MPEDLRKNSTKKGLENFQGSFSKESKKSWVPFLFFLGAGLLLIGGVAFLTPMGRQFLGLDSSPASAVTEEEVFFFVPVPDLLVNLNTSPHTKQRFLKLSLVLEVKSQQEVANITRILPRIIDQFQIYLRELRLENLQGSEGIHRLREELINRANQETHPLKVKDILFRDMLIQ